MEGIDIYLADNHPELSDKIVGRYWYNPNHNNYFRENSGELLQFDPLAKAWYIREGEEDIVILKCHHPQQNARFIPVLNWKVHKGLDSPCDVRIKIYKNRPNIRLSCKNDSDDHRLTLKHPISGVYQWSVEDDQYFNQAEPDLIMKCNPTKCRWEVKKSGEHTAYCEAPNERDIPNEGWKEKRRGWFIKGLKCVVQGPSDLDVTVISLSYEIPPIQSEFQKVPSLNVNLRSINITFLQDEPFLVPSNFRYPDATSLNDIGDNITISIQSAKYANESFYKLLDQIKQESKLIEVLCKETSTLHVQGRTDVSSIASRAKHCMKQYREELQCGDKDEEQLYKVTLSYLPEGIYVPACLIHVYNSCAETHFLRDSEETDHLMLKREGAFLASTFLELLERSQHHHHNPICKYILRDATQLDLNYGFPNGLELTETFKWNALNFALLDIRDYLIIAGHFEESPAGEIQACEKVAELLNYLMQAAKKKAQAMINDMLKHLADAHALELNDEEEPGMILKKYQRFWWALSQRILYPQAIQFDVNTFFAESFNDLQMQTILEYQTDPDFPQRRVDFFANALSFFVMNFMAAELSSPRCFIYPEPGQILEYPGEEVAEVIELRKRQVITVDEKVLVMFPGLYFNDPMQQNAVPVVKWWVQKLE